MRMSDVWVCRILCVEVYRGFDIVCGGGTSGILYVEVCGGTSGSREESFTLPTRRRPPIAQLTASTSS